MNKEIAERAMRVRDIAGAITASLIFSPIITFVMIRLVNEGGGVFFKHGRIGQQGERFSVLKFRSMVPNADKLLQDLLRSDPCRREEWERGMKLKDDPRVTKIGAFLRKTSLDELPQLVNVLKGEMSLVGPRPIVDKELALYGRSAKYYLELKPGMTGLWQVSGRSDINYRRRVAMDRYYAINRNFKLDAYILVKTALIVIRREGAY